MKICPKNKKPDPAYNVDYVCTKKTCKITPEEIAKFQAKANVCVKYGPNPLQGGSFIATPLPNPGWQESPYTHGDPHGSDRSAAETEIVRGVQ